MPPKRCQPDPNQLNISQLAKLKPGEPRTPPRNARKRQKKFPGVGTGTFQDLTTFQDRDLSSSPVRSVSSPFSNDKPREELRITENRIFRGFSEEVESRDSNDKSRDPNRLTGLQPALQSCQEPPQEQASLSRDSQSSYSSSYSRDSNLSLHSRDSVVTVDVDFSDPDNTLPSSEDPRLTYFAPLKHRPLPPSQRSPEPVLGVVSDDSESEVEVKEEPSSDMIVNSACGLGFEEGNVSRESHDEDETSQGLEKSARIFQMGELGPASTSTPVKVREEPRDLEIQGVESRVRNESGDLLANSPDGSRDSSDDEFYSLPNSPQPRAPDMPESREVESQDPKELSDLFINSSPPSRDFNRDDYLPPSSPSTAIPQSRGVDQKDSQSRDLSRLPEKIRIRILQSRDSANYSTQISPSRPSQSLSSSPPPRVQRHVNEPRDSCDNSYGEKSDVDLSYDEGESLFTDPETSRDLISSDRADLADCEGPRNTHADDLVDSSSPVKVGKGISTSREDILKDLESDGLESEGVTGGATGVDKRGHFSGFVDAGQTTTDTDMESRPAILEATDRDGLIHHKLVGCDTTAGELEYAGKLGAVNGVLGQTEGDTEVSFHESEVEVEGEDEDVKGDIEVIGDDESDDEQGADEHEVGVHTEAEDAIKVETEYESDGTEAAVTHTVKTEEEHLIFKAKLESESDHAKEESFERILDVPGVEDEAEDGTELADKADAHGEVSEHEYAEALVESEDAVAVDESDLEAQAQADSSLYSEEGSVILFMSFSETPDTSIIESKRWMDMAPKNHVTVPTHLQSLMSLCHSRLAQNSSNIPQSLVSAFDWSLWLPVWNSILNHSQDSFAVFFLFAKKCGHKREFRCHVTERKHVITSHHRLQMIRGTLTLDDITYLKFVSEQLKTLLVVSYTRDSHVSPTILSSLTGLESVCVLDLRHVDVSDYTLTLWANNLERKKWANLRALLLGKVNVEKILPLLNSNLWYVGYEGEAKSKEGWICCKTKDIKKGNYDIGLKRVLKGVISKKPSSYFYALLREYHGETAVKSFVIETCFGASKKGCKKGRRVDEGYNHFVRMKNY